jgi:hypothetical protein
MKTLFIAMFAGAIIAGVEVNRDVRWSKWEAWSLRSYTTMWPIADIPILCAQKSNVRFTPESGHGPSGSPV